MLLQIFCPDHPPPSTGTVATTAVADPVDFEEMAAEQNRCPETQHFVPNRHRHILACVLAISPGEASTTERSHGYEADAYI
jgi:hypothetical protein